MCLSTVYRLHDGEKQLVCKNVASVRQQDGVLVFTDIMGVQTRVDAVLDRMDLMENFIFLRDKQPAALGREELAYGMQVWVEPISPDETLRQELRGWYRVKHHAIENEAGNRFILDSCGAKWLAYPAKPE